MISSEELDAYIDTQLWKYETLVFEDTELASRIRKALGVGIHRLNTVDVNDPFWSGTNKRPTILKLQPYFSSVLAGDPYDEQARWILIAVALDACENSFAHELLEPLVLRDERQIRWLIGAAEWVSTVSGFDTTEQLQESLARLERLGQFGREKWESVSKDADPMVARAGLIALAVADSVPIQTCRNDYPIPRA